MAADPERHNSAVDRLAVDLSRLLTSGTLAAIPGVGGPVGAVLTELTLRHWWPEKNL